MNVKLERIYESDECTIGNLYIDGVFMCITLENPYNKPKILGKTRIPEGCYKIILREYGIHHVQYASSFADFHKGMLELKNVVNFENILIHIGNTAEDTDGCILVGEKAYPQQSYIKNSTNAYKKIYPLIKKAILRGESVYITIKKKR